MIIECDAVSAYPPEIPRLSYEHWLRVLRLPTSLTAPAVMLWGQDSQIAYELWRSQNRESIYQCQRIIAGWFQQETQPGNRQRR